MPFAELDQRRQSLLFDLATAAAVGLVALLMFQSHAGMVLHGLAMAGALVWRRGRPVVVFGVIAALAAVQLLLLGDRFALVPHDVAVLVAMYSVVKYAGRPRYGVLAGVVCLAGSALPPLALEQAGSWYLALSQVLSVVVTSPVVTSLTA